MDKGPLRTAIENLIHDLVTPGSNPNYWKDFLARQVEADGAKNDVLIKYGIVGIPALPFLELAGLAYAFTGNARIIDIMRELVGKGSGVDRAALLGSIIDQATSAPEVRQIAETYGTLYTEPILSILEQYAGLETTDPKAFYRAVAGVSKEMAAFGAVADFAIESVTAGQFHVFADLAKDMSRSMGVEYVAFNALTPLLDSGLKPGMNTYYKRLYRPERFSISDVRDLYALGQISKDDLYEAARNLGWRDKDIPTWLQLAFRKLSEAEILQAWKLDIITQDQAAERIRELGFDPADIGLIFALNPKDDPNAERDTTASTARQAFRDNLIPESELRSLLAALKYGGQEIDLIVQIEKAKSSATTKSLSLGQIKSAWQDNVLSDAEAVHWLKEDNYGDDQIALILATWKVEISPKYRKLNASTIEGAYVEGILSRNDTLNKLISVGLTPGDADLELKLVEARNPEAFGSIPNAKAKKLTPGTLSDLVLLGLITPAQMSARLQDVGYTVDDANLLSEAARLRAQPGPRQLSDAAIQAAYMAGVITRATASDQLASNGYSAAQAGELLDTLEAKNPTAFGLPAQQRVKQLSPSDLQDLFLRDLLSVDQYAARLADLGLSDADVQLEVARAQQLKAPGNRTLTQSAIERAYLAGVYDRQTAFDRLVAQDFSEEDANTILDTIEAQNPAAFTPGLIQSTRQPSITTLVSALQNGVIDEQTYYARAQELGYQTTDAQMYLSLATNQVKKSTVTLSASEIRTAYGQGLMTRGVALDRLTTRGYSNDDATLLLRMTKDFIQGTDTWDQLLSGNLAAFDAVSALVNAHYSDNDIIDAFAALPASTLAALQLDLGALKETLAAIPGGQ